MHMTESQERKIKMKTKDAVFDAASSMYDGVWFDQNRMDNRLADFDRELKDSLSGEFFYKRETDFYKFFDMLVIDSKYDWEHDELIFRIHLPTSYTPTPEYIENHKEWERLVLESAKEISKCGGDFYPRLSDIPQCYWRSVK